MVFFNISFNLTWVWWKKKRPPKSVIMRITTNSKQQKGCFLWNKWRFFVMQMIFARHMKSIVETNCWWIKKRLYQEQVLSEIMTILIMYHLSWYKNFKWYYTKRVMVHQRKDYPDIVSYNRRFVEIMKFALAPLILYMIKVCLGKWSGISFVDFTPIKVCDNHRISSITLSKVMMRSFRQMNLNWFRQNSYAENLWESSITAKAFLQQESYAVTAETFMVQKYGIQPVSIGEWFGGAIINLMVCASATRRIYTKMLSKKNSFLLVISCLKIMMKFLKIVGWCRICLRIALK